MSLIAIIIISIYRNKYLWCEWKWYYFYNVETSKNKDIQNFNNSLSNKVCLFLISYLWILVQYWKFILNIFWTYLIIKKLRIVGNTLFLFHYIALSSLLIDHELSDKIFFTTKNELRMNNWTTEEKYLPQYNRRKTGTHAIMYITNIWCYVIYMSWYRQSKKWVIFCELKYLYCMVICHINIWTFCHVKEVSEKLLNRNSFDWLLVIRYLYFI